MFELSRITETKPKRLAKAGIISTSLVLILGGLISAQQPGQTTFPSPEDASQALFAAAQRDDKTTLLAIFGPAGGPIISSGDPVWDKNSRETFVAKYQEMHRVQQERDGTVLYIGAENWPLPVPLVHKGDAWYFDTETGAKEILFRRIGRNELEAMRVLHALVDAENDYYSQPRDGKAQQYALKFVSDGGKHNGLYWTTSRDEAESPIGPLIASAAAEGYGKEKGAGPTPFHGYFYRILTGQGNSAPGGAKSYIVDEHMTGGFAILAYPADYRSSGVMTFIVSHDGVIYQKDLGSKTAELGNSLKEYAPDRSWQKAE